MLILDSIKMRDRDTELLKEVASQKNEQIIVQQLETKEVIHLKREQFFLVELVNEVVYEDLMNSDNQTIMFLVA